MKFILPNACWAQAVGHRCLIAEARVRFLVSPYEIFGARIDIGHVFLQYFGFPLLYHSIFNPKRSFIHLYTNPKGKRSKAGNFEM